MFYSSQVLFFKSPSFASRFRIPSVSVTYAACTEHLYGTISNSDVRRKLDIVGVMQIHAN
jgi:hypothetical protein